MRFFISIQYLKLREAKKWPKKKTLKKEDRSGAIKVQVLDRMMERIVISHL